MCAGQQGRNGWRKVRVGQQLLRGFRQPAVSGGNPTQVARTGATAHLVQALLPHALRALPPRGHVDEHDLRLGATGGRTHMRLDEAGNREQSGHREQRWAMDGARQCAGSGAGAGSRAGTGGRASQAQAKRQGIQEGIPPAPGCPARGSARRAGSSAARAPRCPGTRPTTAAAVGGAGQGRS